MPFLRKILMVILVLSLPTMVRGQTFCLSDPSINSSSAEEFISSDLKREKCEIYWINVYLHIVKGYIVDGQWNGWESYNSTIGHTIMDNLNSSFNEYGIYFELAGTRDWFSLLFSDPYTDQMVFTGIFEDPDAERHSDAIDIYLLPANSPVQGGFVPASDRTVMIIGGVQTVEHCSGDTVAYKVATTKVISHEMGHCLGLPHTFEVEIGTTTDHVTRKSCVDPKTCQFVNDCKDCNVNSNPTLIMNNYMSYTVPNCMSEFSNEQVQVMKNELSEQLSSIVSRSKESPPTLITELTGPSEVTEGTIAAFSVDHELDEDELYNWSCPPGFLLVEHGLNGESVEVLVGSEAENGPMQVWKSNFCGDSDVIEKYVTVESSNCPDCATIRILPNPALDEIYVSHLLDKTDNEGLFPDPVDYKIINTQGRMIYSFTSRKKNLRLDLKQIRENGVYILNVRRPGQEVIRYRFVINR